MERLDKGVQIKFSDVNAIDSRQGVKKHSNHTLKLNRA